VKEYGWPELKKGNTREALICKNTISKILYEHFLEKSVNQNEEAIYSLSEEEEEIHIEEEGVADIDSKARNCPKHNPEDLCPQDCPSRKNTARKRDSDHEEGPKPKKLREERVSKRELRKKLESETILKNIVEDEASEEVSSAHKRITAPKKATSRGRRWIRFACEKHRREHARCPDNCSMRKKSYVEEEESIDDEATPDDMESESQSVCLHNTCEEEVIIDESSL